MRSPRCTTSAERLGALIFGASALVAGCAEPDAEPVRSEVAAAEHPELRQMIERERELAQAVEAQLRAALQDAEQRAQLAEQRAKDAEQTVEASEGRASSAEANEHALLSQLESLRAEPAELAREDGGGGPGAGLAGGQDGGERASGGPPHRKTWPSSLARWGWSSATHASSTRCAARWRRSEPSMMMADDAEEEEEEEEEMEKESPAP